MTHFATLITSPVAPCAADLVPALASAARDAGSPGWVASGAAADIPLAPPEGSRNIQWASGARVALDDVPIDVVARADAGLRKRPIVVDVDSASSGPYHLENCAAGRRP